MCAGCDGACIEVDRDINEFCGHRERCSVKLKAGLRIAAQVLLVAFQSQAVAEAGPPVGAPAQHFVCNTGYSLTRCQADMAVLRKSLARYPVAELGEWTWVLVRSADWKYIVMPRGIDPDSPAFTYLPKRETFIEEALVAIVPQRAGELILRWQMSTDDLRELAVAHELAHVLCNEANEAKANRAARTLLEGSPLSCEARLEATTRMEETRKQR
jgi:hypothetical protein